jgi:hypothetical protein
MGWWQGRLLRDRIRRHHERAEALLAAGPAGPSLVTTMDAYVAQTLARMPEALRQELDGLAAGSGVPARDLLRAEVMRDGLRFHEGRARPFGGLLLSTDGGRALLALPRGEAAALGSDLVLVGRRPPGGAATLVVAWPGSLGGFAGASSRGLGYVALEAEADLRRQRIGDVPFSALARRALERADSAGDLLARLSGTTAHGVLVLDGPGGRAHAGTTGLVVEEGADLALAATTAVLTDLPPDAPAETPPSSFEEARAAWGAGLPWFSVAWGGDALEVLLSPSGGAPARARAR